MAGPQGFEPQLPESKSGVLPLDEEPINEFASSATIVISTIHLDN